MASTTLTTFSPSANAPVEFNPTLAGSTYTALITWNAVSGYYYLTLSDSNGNPLISLLMAESGPQIPALLSWADGLATVVCAQAHNVPVGELANVRVANSDSDFDGNVQVLSVSATTLTFTLPANPNEPAPIDGTVSFDVNLVDTVVEGGLFLYHVETQQLETA
jgi:hypothetical protein